MNESDAIDLLKHGDINGLEWLVITHQAKAVRIAYLITRDIPLAEDIVQDAFVHVYQIIDQFDERRPFTPWFMRSVVNSALKKARKEARQVPIDSKVNGKLLKQLVESRSTSPENQTETSEFQSTIWAAMGKLSPRQRAAIVQRYFLDMSEKEMSGELGSPVGTVKWLLNSARSKLRALLGSERNGL
jgi:RNA polymerase sigma-70 factor (ECF subfamily)